MNFAELLVPDFSLILFGYLLCRFTALDRRVWSQVDQLVYYVLFPALLFHAVVRSPLDPGAAMSLAGAALSLGVAAIILSLSLPHWPVLGRHIDPGLHAASAQIGFRFNSFIALALAERLAGASGLLMMAVIISVCVPLFNLGAVWPMARHGKKRITGELLRNPLILATGSGLAANLMGLGIPAWLEPGLSRVGQASLALGLMAAGAGMQLGSLAQARILGTAVLSIKHLGMPLIALGLAWLFALSPEQSLMLLMFSAMPTAASSYVLASRMGYDGSYVAGLVTLSTVLGMLSLPLAFWLLARL